MIRDSSPISVAPPCRFPLLAGQLLLALAALAWLMLRPEDGQPILIVPLPAVAADNAPRFAVAHGARLLGPGPIAGSVVIRGGDDGLAAQALAAGLLLVAADGGCGGGTPA